MLLYIIERCRDGEWSMAGNDYPLHDTHTTLKNAEDWLPVYQKRWPGTYRISTYQRIS
jgi:hypothetical protein